MYTIDPEHVERRLEKLKRVCENAGMRMTHQRREIFFEVARTGEHPDAETIFSRVRIRLPNVSRDTVYRTLASLEEMGLVSRVDPIGGRARYDANCDAHHHFICTRCGSVTDIYLDENEELPRLKGIKNLGKAETMHLQVRGICHQCKRN